MASSSSSSHSNHAWSYDVFLSFRGEDTRKGFVDHLYTALVQRGIHTYKDDETLARGEQIAPALLKAIQESRIAVIVFSENYADSSWCLDELAYILECMDTRGQIVMPVFYDVEPSDVRKLKKKYGEAFTKHELEHKHKVESWKTALRKASDISGWSPKNFASGHEAECIKDIVGTISGRLSLLVTNDSKDLIGMETRLRDLKAMLEIGSSGVLMVGIWGVGGGGKTSLASAAYMEISHQFEACCLFENIREESNKYGLKKLQENFLSLVLKTNEVVGSEIEGRSMIKRRLCNKRVFVVLDDVDDLEQLEALAGSHDWFGIGSRIIVTTRDEHLLTRYADKIYEVRLLSRDEAIKLFNKHAYWKDKPIKDYEMLSKEVVSYADGLPLALKVLGSFLYDKDKDEWKGALAKLKCLPNVKVIERLKISYDGLEPDQQTLFLDIACLWRRWFMDDAMLALHACNLHPVIGIKVLVQKSLIKFSDGEFDMHDLIEEMAHNIVRGEHPKNPEKHSRIWNWEDMTYLCDIGADALPMDTEVIVLRTIASQHPGLSNVIANMKKLRCIYFVGYPASSFPSNFHPTELSYLKLYASQQKELWHGYKYLPNLKTLDLARSKNLIKTPDIGGLPCLEILILKHCESLEEIHPSIGHHKGLVFLDMSSCYRLKRFPPIIQMEKLETLDLSSCYQLQQFPDIRANMDSLVTLNFSGTGIEIIPPSIGRFCTNLVLVNMSYCKRLKRFPPITQMKKLETLDLSFCYQLQQFPDIQSNMDSLVTLDLRHTGIEIIPTSVGQFCTNLVSFNTSGCSKLKRIEANFNLLKSLKYLTLFSVSQMQPRIPRSRRKLNRSNCNLGDGDIQWNIIDILDLRESNLSNCNLGDIDIQRNICDILDLSVSSINCCEI